MIVLVPVCIIAARKRNTIFEVKVCGRKMSSDKARAVYDCYLSSCASFSCVFSDVKPGGPQKSRLEKVFWYDTTSNNLADLWQFSCWFRRPPVCVLMANGSKLTL